MTLDRDLYYWLNELEKQVRPKERKRILAIVEEMEGEGGFKVTWSKITLRELRKRIEEEKDAKP